MDSILHAQTDMLRGKGSKSLKSTYGIFDKQLYFYIMQSKNKYEN